MIGFENTYLILLNTIQKQNNNIVPIKPVAQSTDKEIIIVKTRIIKHLLFTL